MEIYQEEIIVTYRNIEHKKDILPAPCITFLRYYTLPYHLCKFQMRKYFIFFWGILIVLAAERNN